MMTDSVNEKLSLLKIALASSLSLEHRPQVWGPPSPGTPQSEDPQSGQGSQTSILALAFIQSLNTTKAARFLHNCLPSTSGYLERDLAS